MRLIVLILIFISGDHTYKQNKDLPAEEQMITALPDIKVLEITPEDEFMVLACDGIWNSMSNQEVVDYVKERIDLNPEKLSSICEEVCIIYIYIITL